MSTSKKQPPLRDRIAAENAAARETIDEGLRRARIRQDFARVQADALHRIYVRLGEILEALS